MRTIQSKLDEIRGIDLGRADQKVLTGGDVPAYPYCYCYYEDFLLNWGYCGTGTPTECEAQLEALYPGSNCECDPA